VPLAGFEPTIPASEQPHTHTLDHAASGTGYIKIYRIVILLAVLCVLKIQPVSVREGHKLRVFENRMLREILVQYRAEVMENSDVYILKSFVFLCFELDSACSICERDENVRSLAWKT
jgi:hypothetical protein